jgi:DNA mismatch repair protein MutL
MVTGLISPPIINRANRKHIIFFVNHRIIRSALLTRAVEEGYHGLLMTGRYPLVFINVTVPPEVIDVNVHPTKSEVRFSNEQAIFSAVRSAVHKSLSGDSQIKLADINQQISQPDSQEDYSRIRLNEATNEPVTQALFPDTTTSSNLPILRVIGQIANCYIIAEGGDGLYLIDQHAAHERIIYEKINKERQLKKVEVQSLLEPIVLELNPKQAGLFNVTQEILTQFGFTIDQFGQRTYLIRTIPASLLKIETSRVISEILDTLEENSTLHNREEQIAISIACHGVIRAGQVLSQEEMKNMIRMLEQTDMPRTCPHGRPTMIHLSSLQLAREFGRTNSLL